MASSRWYHKLSIIRWIFAIFGILIMVFSGGCSFLIVAENPGGFSVSFQDLIIIGMFGGIPFLVGLLIWWLAAKVGR